MSRVAPVANDTRRKSRARLWVTAATLVLAVAVTLVAERRVAALATQPVRESPYVGSASCERCHRSAYQQWRSSVHARMTQPATPPAVAGDFLGRDVLRKGGRTATPRVERDGFVMHLTDGTAATQWPVHYLLGDKRFQGYMTRLDDGRIYVLPAFWHIGWKRWIDWTEITPVPDSDVDARQIWNINCFNCHATNIQRNYNERSRTFATTWSEMGVGCEACHGPGAEHVDRMVAWGRDPSTYPEIDPSSRRPEVSRELAIFSPRTAPPRATFDMCAYCHGNKTNAFVGFAPGDRLEDYAQLSLVSDPVPSHDPQGDYWPDGRPSRFNRPQALTESGCFAKGGATCASCHAAHSSEHEHSLEVPLSRSNELCTQCHRDIEPAHTHHDERSQGSSCVACHMSEVNWRLLNRRRDHTFAAPVPEVTARYGAPNACTTCHDDRSPEWAARTMDTWYGDGARRAKALATADAFYAAGSGEQRALPALATLAVDRTRGSLVRASAAGFLGRLLAPAAPPLPAGTAATVEARTSVAPHGVDRGAINALVAAASDPEAMVRTAAVQSLTGIDEALVRSALVARLEDSARVVRARAAESLLRIGVAALPGRAGQALARAQDELAVSLRTFADMPSQRTSLGWLLGSRGQVTEGVHELRQAIALDPSLAEPHVYLGVLAARAERYDEAIAHWTTARRLGATQVVGLIELATARRTQRDALR